MAEGRKAAIVTGAVRIEENAPLASTVRKATTRVVGPSSVAAERAGALPEAETLNDTPLKFRSH